MFTAFIQETIKHLVTQVEMCYWNFMIFMISGIFIDMFDNFKHCIRIYSSSDLNIDDRFSTL